MLQIVDETEMYNLVRCPDSSSHGPSKISSIK